jgi:hypothetical protein
MLCEVSLAFSEIVDIVNTFWVIPWNGRKGSRGCGVSGARKLRKGAVTDYYLGIFRFFYVLGGIYLAPTKLPSQTLSVCFISPLYITCHICVGNV